MNSRDLLLFDRVVRRVLLLVIPELPLVVSGFGGFWDSQGCCPCLSKDSVINESMRQSVGTIESSGV